MMGNLTPEPLMRMAQSLGVFKALAIGVELDFFTRISGRSIDANDFGKMYNLQTRPVEALLAVWTSLGLLERKDGKYRNSALSEEYLIRGKPYYFGGYVNLHDKRLYLAWHRLADAVKTNRPPILGEGKSSIFESFEEKASDARTFLEAMHSVSMSTGKALAEAYDFSRHKVLMDVGGGSAAYPIEIVKRYPDLRAVVYDLSSVCPIAEEKISGAGLNAKITTHAGDFLKEDLPRIADIHLLSLILHDWTPKNNVKILGKCYDALPSGGVIIIAELMMNDDKTGPLEAALMSLNMLIQTEGANYTWAEYESWLAQVGFRHPRRIPLKAAAVNGVLLASKP